ncbi:MAG: sulfite exporter TauE/SafE family protein [Rubrivivax sp.]|nr:sulfite exporter TauE/SafE family protein [Rubrivivax sp.]
MPLELLEILAGFGVGLLVGLTGVGGGALMTPLLLLLFGVAPATAVGTDLWFAGITKIFGSAAHARRDSIDWEVARRLWTGSLPAAALTLAAMHLAGTGGHRDSTITTALGMVLLLTAAAMLARNHLHRLGRRLRLAEPGRFKRLQPAATVAAGAVLGVLVTLTSVGAGALGAVMLMALYPLRMSPARLVGTDLVHAVPLTLLAGLGHLAMGHVQFALLGLLLMGAIPGVLLGARLCGRLPEAWLRSLIAAVLTFSALRLLR